MIEITGSTAGNAFLVGATNQAKVRWSFSAVPPSNFSYEIKDDMGNVLALGNGPNASGERVLCENQTIVSCYPPGPHWVRYSITTNTGATQANSANFTVVQP